VSKPWTPNKPTVELRQSRIRRDPVPLQKPAEAAKTYWDPSEWDTWVVVVGVLAFAVALSIAWIGISDITS
jgi:hypothetical protein